MNLWGDLQSARAMYWKAGLFLVAGAVCAAGLLVQSPDVRTAFLVGVMVWSFCRLYYFLFYVIEKYIDPSFRFDGVLSAIRFLLKEARGKKPPMIP